MKKIVALLSGAVLGVSALAACSAAPDTRPVVLVYGDSLTVLSEQAATQSYPKYHFIFQAEGGTAMCDWSPRAAPNRITYKPVQVVLAFTGNTASCAAADYAAGGLIGAIGNYQRAMIQFAHAFVGIPVRVIGSPAMHDNIGWFPMNGNPQLNAMYQSESAQLGLTYSSAADNDLTPGHVFTYTRPGYRNGAPVVVRTQDGIHLTPAGALYYGDDFLR